MSSFTPIKLIYYTIAGGSTDSQRDFLEALSNSDARRNLDRQNSKTPPIANNFALGYTYYDVLDTDQEGIFYVKSESTETSR
jgi:dynein light intermediate chain 1, cytosolic